MSDTYCEAAKQNIWAQAKRLLLDTTHEPADDKWHWQDGIPAYPTTDDSDFWTEVRADIRKKLRRPRLTARALSRLSRTEFYEVDWLGPEHTNKLTICLDYVWTGAGEWRSGAAWCSPSDNFERKIGRQISRRRAQSGGTYFFVPWNEAPIEEALIHTVLLDDTPRWAGNLTHRTGVLGGIFRYGDIRR